MSSWSILATLAANDIRLVRRDNLLRWMLLLPVALTALARWGLGPLADSLRQWFDLEPYYPLVASYALLLSTSLTFGQVTGFLLLDEREDRTLSALRVTPVPFNFYLVYRISAPTVLSAVASVLCVKLSGIVEVGWGPLVAASVVASLAASGPAGEHGTYFQTFPMTLSRSLTQRSRLAFAGDRAVWDAQRK